MVLGSVIAGGGVNMSVYTTLLQLRLREQWQPPRVVVSGGIY